MYLFGKPSHYSLPSSCYHQVLTGVLPYHGSDSTDMITRFRAGERPSHPINPSGNRWLPDPVWDIITTGWHEQPNKRCELSVMYDVLSLSSEHEVQHVKPGRLNAQNSGSRTIVRTSRPLKRQSRKILPRIASLFQFIQNPEPGTGIQGRVNQMNEVSFSTPTPPLVTDATCSALRTTPCQIGND